MSNIGILAYGSLIVDPGKEIQPRIVKIKDAITPFNVEFARKSETRDYEPTLIPVKEGGARVKAKILILKEDISEKEATDMLYRRETDQICSKEEYKPPEKPYPNKIEIKKIEGFRDVKIVLYTEIGKNIDCLTPKELAELAIKSARCLAGKRRKDGISYLTNAKRSGISTPLTNEYEKEVLRQTNSKNLQEAWEVLTHEWT